MGICCSSHSRGRRTKERDWRGENDCNDKFNIKSSKGNYTSNDFNSLISKLNGGGGAAGLAAQERALHQIPGRLFVNGGSRIACLHTQQGKKGTNQDAMLIWEDFCPWTDATFCGVFDGHGPFGHMVARKVRDCLPLFLRTEWESISKLDQNSGSQSPEVEVLEDDCGESTESEGVENFPGIHMSLKRSFLKAFKLMDKELKLHPTIDCFCSGTTAVTLIMKGQDLIIGNLGDSRAVLATKDNDNTLMAVQLTVDLKPNLPREAARIQKYKGRVFALQEEPEVSRVWLPNSDSPGLAMARAFGDFCLKDFGLISVPDVYYHQITPKDEFVVLASDGPNSHQYELREWFPPPDVHINNTTNKENESGKVAEHWDVNSQTSVPYVYYHQTTLKDEFVVLASDGIWDVLSNKETVDVVASAPSRATAARALVDSATRAWRLKYPTSKMDDCAVVCLFLEHPAPGGLAIAGNVCTELPKDEMKMMTTSPDLNANMASQISVLVRGSGEIEPVVESVDKKIPENGVGQSKRSLAECILTAEDEEWTALEGITRVNSLLSIPRFLSLEKRTGSWRKWL